MKELNIVLSDELYDAIHLLTISYPKMTRSEIIEALLRENDIVMREIRIMRFEPKSGVLAVSPKRLREKK